MVVRGVSSCGVFRVLKKIGIKNNGPTLLLLLISVGSRFPGVEPIADDKNGRRKAYFIRAYHDDR